MRISYILVGFVFTLQLPTFPAIDCRPGLENPSVWPTWVIGQQVTLNWDNSGYANSACAASTGTIEIMNATKEVVYTFPSSSTYFTWAEGSQTVTVPNLPPGSSYYLFDGITNLGPFSIVAASVSSTPSSSTHSSSTPASSTPASSTISTSSSTSIISSTLASSLSSSTALVAISVGLTSSSSTSPTSTSSSSSNIPQSSANSSDSKSITQSTTPGTQSSTPTIIGSVIGAVGGGVVATIGFIIYLRRRRYDPKPPVNDPSPTKPGKTDPNISPDQAESLGNQASSYSSPPQNVPPLVPRSPLNDHANLAIPLDSGWVYNNSLEQQPFPTTSQSYAYSPPHSHMAIPNQSSPRNEHAPLTLIQGTFVPNQHPSAFVPNQHPSAFVPNQHPSAFSPNQHPSAFAPNQHPSVFAANEHPSAYAPNQYPSAYAPNQYS